MAHLLINHVVSSYLKVLVKSVFSTAQFEVHIDPYDKTNNSQEIILNTILLKRNRSLNLQHNMSVLVLTICLNSNLTILFVCEKHFHD